MRLSHVALLLVAALFLSTLTAHADIIKGFTLSGAYAFDPADTPSGPPVSGTIQIDVTTGIVTGIYLNDPFGASIPFAGDYVGYYSPVEIAEAWEAPPDGEDIQMDLLLPVTTLVGYDGGNLCSFDNPCSDNGNNLYSSFGTIHGDEFIYGALTATPEPSSVILLGAGALTMIGLARGKRFA